MFKVQYIKNSIITNILSLYCIKYSEIYSWVKKIEKIKKRNLPDSKR